MLGNGAGGFTASGATIPVGTAPVSLVVADFNGDGAQDLAVANLNSGNVSVLLGNGSGGFSTAPGSPYAVGTFPASIATGDFNGDGIPDLAIANDGSNNVTVLLSSGGGRFSPATASPFPVGTGPVAVVVGDFNGDGNLDFATANPQSNNVSVLLGNGLGGFNPAPGNPYAVGQYPLALVAGDFNGDGIPDLAAVNSTDNTVTILVGSASGPQFVPSAGGAYAVGTKPSSPLAGDFNGDGILDLATLSYSGNTLTVLVGGKAQSSSVLSTTSPASIQVGQSVPLTLAVSDTGGGFGAPTGSVTILDGSTVLGAASQTTTPYTFSATGLAAGNHTLTASYPGDSRTTASTSNGVTIQVTAAGSTAQTITFASPGAVTLPASALTLVATASSGLPVTFASSTTSVCTVSGTTLTPVAAGTCTITASQPGNATYAAATPVTQSFTINPASTGGGGGGGGGTGGGNPLSVSPTAVTVTAQVGGATASQTVTISYATFTQGAPTWTSNFSTNQGQGWIGVSPSSGTMTQASYAGFLYTYTATVSITGNPNGILVGSSYTGAVNFSAGSGIISVPVTFNVTAQVLPAPTGGIANAASAGQATPSVVSLGSYIAIYGTQLAGTGTPLAANTPLPTTLNGTSMTLGGLPMPLLYAASGQVDALVPQGLKPSNSYPLVVTTGQLQSLPVMLIVNELQPGIYTVDTSGSGAGIVADALTGQLINASNPAKAGQYLVVYCTGLGPVLGPNGEAAPADGVAAPGNLLYSTVAGVTATIGGVSAPVSFSGLTPTFVGLYQVNVQMPSGVTPGNSVKVVLTATDAKTGATGTSNTVTIVTQ